MTIKEMSEVMLKASDTDSKIQWRPTNWNGKWIDGESLNIEFRVAPQPRKPREWWIHPTNAIFDCAYKDANMLSTTLVHVREVIE